MIYRNDELRLRLGGYARCNTVRFDPEALIEDYVQFFAGCAQGRQNVLPRVQKGKVGIFFGARDSQGVPHLQPREIDMCAEFDLSESAHP
jgi:hypothetical protein